MSSHLVLQYFAIVFSRQVDFYLISFALNLILKLVLQVYTADMLIKSLRNSSNHVLLFYRPLLSMTLFSTPIISFFPISEIKI